MGVQDAVSEKKAVVVRAPALSLSGYGVHSRQIVRWLLSHDDIELYVQPVQWGCTPWYIDASACDGLIGKIMERSKMARDKFDVSFQVQLPNEWDPKLATVNVGVTAGVETDVCNPDWVKCLDSMQHVVVPSTFTRDVFLRSGKLEDPTKVCVIPESFPDAILSDVNPIGLKFFADFNFLLVGQMTGRSAENDRKNIFNTIKWFCETFEGDETTGLVIKTNNGRETRIDRKVTVDTLTQFISSVRKGPFPKIHILHGTFSDAEMSAIYRHPQIKAFLSLTRGEGFGLPILEAAASGLPVIVPNWSGYLDFMKLGKFVKVDFELRPLHPSRVDGKIFTQASKWAETFEQDAKRKMKKFRERHKVPTEWAAALKPIIQERFSFKTVSSLYESTFGELLR